MLDWIRSLFFRDDRCLFRYWDGAKQRESDPIAAHRGVWLDEDCQLLEDGPISLNPRNEDGTAIYPIAEVVAAENRIRALTRKVFGVQEWKEGQPGLTALETDELMNRFIEFCEGLKKKRAPSRTLPAPSESMEHSPSSDIEGFPDGPQSDYSSMPTASSDGVPSG